MSRPSPSRGETARTSDADAATEHLCRRVKELRKLQGWTLESLAAASGVSRSMLSQIERNETNPTLSVAFRVARAFDMTLGELLESHGPPARIDVVRSEDPTSLIRSDRDCRLRTLSPLHLEKQVEFYELRLQPNGALRSAAHVERTREFLTVQLGRVRLTSDGDVEDLATGDSASYRADVPHSIENIGPIEAILFLVVIYE